MNQVEIKPHRIGADHKLPAAILKVTTFHRDILNGSRRMHSPQTHRHTEKTLVFSVPLCLCGENALQNAVRKNDAICQPSMYLKGASPVV